MKISVCNKCKGYDFNKILNILKELYPDAKYEIGCNNMCGVGRNKVVVIINDKPIICENINELINKLKEVTI